MVSGQVQGVTLPLPQMLHRRRRSWNLTHSGKQAEQGKPVALLWVGRSQDQPIVQRVKDAGGSEGDAVMASIRVQNLPAVKTSRLPAGV